jgi:hypothetical protein
MHLAKKTIAFLALAAAISLTGCLQLYEYETPVAGFPGVYTVNLGSGHPDYSESPYTTLLPDGRLYSTNQRTMIKDPISGFFYPAQEIKDPTGKVIGYEMTPQGRKERDDYNRQRLGFDPEKRDGGGGGGDGGGGGGD